MWLAGLILLAIALLGAGAYDRFGNYLKEHLSLILASSDGMAPSFLAANLGKRSLTLDLKNPKAKEIVHKLVAEADVLVENFKPGTIERLGFGFEAMKAIKPDLVYASISGFGQTGPRANLPAFDGAIQA